MKKLLVFVLVIGLLCTFAACSGGTEPPSPTSNGKTEPSGNTEGLESLDTELFTVWFDGDVWTYDEEDLYDDAEYAEILLGISDEEDSYKASIEIIATIDDAEEFRDYLYDYGFDLQEFAVNKGY